MKLLVLSLVTVGVVAGCNEPKKPEATKPIVVEKGTSSVVVPPFVQGKWKAVRIEVTDKITRKSSVYTIPIGSSLKVPDSDITIAVENFLPHFVMEGTTLTSQSNDLKNPAAQVRISQAGHEIYKGWLFKMFPTIHAFQHPQFGFALTGYLSS